MAAILPCTNIVFYLCFVPACEDVIEHMLEMSGTRYMDSTLGFQPMYVKIMQLNLNWWQVMCVQDFLTFCFIVTVIRVQMLCSQQPLFITMPIVTMFEFLSYLLRQEYRSIYSKFCFMKSGFASS